MNLPKPKVIESGQALLLVLLVMAVTLTIVLSVSSRSITELQITTTEEDSLRAFSAAEAGIEKALLNPVIGSPVTGNPGSDTSTAYTYQVTDPSSGGSQFKYGDGLKSGEVATFWLVSHDSSGQFTCSGGKPCYSGGPGRPVRVCWGNIPEPTLAERPAVEALIFYDPTLQSIASTNNYAGVQVARVALDRNASSRTPPSGFQSTQIGLNGCVIDGKTYLYQSPNLTQGLCVTTGCILMIKVRLYYSSSAQVVGFTFPGSTIPSQGFVISSSGTSGETNRKISVFQGYADSPSLFDAAVFSMGNLDK